MQNLSGLWRSHYNYFSSSRQGEFESEHQVRVHQTGNRLVVESVPGEDASYLIIKLHIDDDVATGNWHEQTEKSGHYQGATYFGGIQLVLSKDGKRLEGKWVGFGKKGEVKTGPWELERIE